MQRICKEYVQICTKYAQNKQIKYAKIWTNMQIICKKYAYNMRKICRHIICQNMQHSLYQRNMQKYAKICKLYACYMQKHAKYAITFFICRICKNMHSPLCWCQTSDTVGRYCARAPWRAGSRAVTVLGKIPGPRRVHSSYRGVREIRQPNEWSQMYRMRW